MNRAFGALLLAIILLAGCSNRVSGNKATLASAEGFRKALLAELRRLGPVDEFGGGQSRAGNVHTVEYTYTLSSDRFSREQLETVAKKAMSTWGEFDAYPTRGEQSGGSNFHFGIHYGSGATQAFIDLFPIRDGKDTRVEVLIRVVE